MKKVIVFLAAFAFICLGWSAKAQTKLWGMTYSGGNTNGGTIFKINEDGTNLNSLYSFINDGDTGNSPGYAPVGSLLQSNNGKLYGACHDGGHHHSCCIFSFDPITNSYSDLYDFDITHGDYPLSGLVESSNGNLYGVASAGGTSLVGVLYSFDPSTNTYTDLYEFEGINGAQPIGHPICLSNNKLYGMTNVGGSNAFGVIYCYDIASNTYSDLYDLTGIGGSGSWGSLLQANNGLLYGMTMSGGTDSLGVIFSFDVSSNTYTVLHNFNGTNGSGPSGSLIQLSNGKLAGMTMTGGLNNLGVIFTFDIGTNDFSSVHDFNSSTGSTPWSEFKEDGNGILFGSTSNGGQSGNGVIFKYDLSSNNYSDIFDFNGTNGPNVQCALTTIVNTGISNIENNNDISIYPNPASTLLNIHLSTCTSQETLLITDLLGTVVYKAELHGIDNTISISTWSAGIYLYEVRSGLQIPTSVRGKFVVQK